MRKKQRRQQAPTATVDDEDSEDEHGDGAADGDGDGDDDAEADRVALARVGAAGSAVLMRLQPGGGKAHEFDDEPHRLDGLIDEVMGWGVKKRTTREA